MDGFLEMVKIIALIVEIRNFNPNKTVMDKTEYITNKEQCQSTIDKRMPIVCSSCGGKLEPIKTVDNANNPTYWIGCMSCMKFDNGVSPRVYETAKYMVTERHFMAYREPMPEKEDTERYNYWLKSQIGGTCSIVYDILNFNPKQ